MKKITRKNAFKMTKKTETYFDKGFERMRLNSLTTPWVGKTLKHKKIDKRKEEMLKMKALKMTNVAIGKHFGISYERVRQIIGNFGRVDGEIINIQCPVCKKHFKFFVSQNRKHCSRKCSGISKRLNQKKTIEHYSKAENKALSKIRNDKRKEARRLYYQRPDVKKKKKAYQKTAGFKKYQREYYQKNKRKNAKKK